jgi:hypothetical protein
MADAANASCTPSFRPRRDTVYDGMAREARIDVTMVGRAHSGARVAG